MARVSFQVEGEFITNLSRQWFWDEDKDYEVVEELLLSCLVTDEISLDERKSIAQSIIEGKKKLVGINEFSLEDDNEKVRPIYDKIRQLKRKAMIKEIEEDIEINPINYIDVYSTIHNYEMFEDYMEQYHDGIEHYTYDDVIEYFGKYERTDMYMPQYEEPTMAGLWLLEKASLIFDVFGKKITKSNQSEFFEKLYQYLKANDNEGLYEKRQTRYEILNDLPYMTKEKLIKEEKKLPAYNKDDYRFEEPDLNYYKKADDLLSEYGWIDRYGEWYSCDFGGHQCKAQTIVTGNGKILKDYYQWLQQEGKHVEKQSNFADGKQYSYKEWQVPSKTNSNYFISGYELYQEYLLRKGWIKFHNPNGGECYPEKYLKPTKEQLNTMFKTSIKRGYKKIQGLDEE